MQIKFGQPSEKTCVAKEGDEPKAYQFTLNIECDSDYNNTASWLHDGSAESNDVCSPTVTIRHAKACPVFSASKFSKFFLNNPLILASVFILLGPFIAGKGREFFGWTIYGTGVLSGFGITMLLFTMLSMFESARAEDQGGRLELTYIGTTFTYVASLTIGLFLGFILQRMLKVGAGIISFIGGYLISIPIINLLFGWVDSETFLSVLSFLIAVAVTVLSLQHYDNIIIFGTSIIGSYIFVRGISLIFGGFPPESEVFHRIATGDVEGIFYAYLAFFTGIVGLGVFLQRKKMEEDRIRKFFA